MKNLLLPVFVFIQYSFSLPNWISPEEFENINAAASTTITPSTEISIGVRSKLCDFNKDCILLSHCKNECNSVKQGLLQTDIKV